jgi:hypothetical protein
MLVLLFLNFLSLFLDEFDMAGDPGQEQISQSLASSHSSEERLLDAILTATLARRTDRAAPAVFSGKRSRNPR